MPDLASELERLHRQRGANTLDNKPFDDQHIDRAEHAIGTAVDAEAVATERARETARQALENIAAKTMVEIADNQGDIIKRIASLEAHTRGLVDDRAAIEALSKAQRGLWKTLGDKVPGHMGELQRRLSMRFAAVMGSAGWGVTGWRMSWLKPEDSWADAERIEGEKAFAEITKKRDSQNGR